MDTNHHYTLYIKGTIKLCMLKVLGHEMSISLLHSSFRYVHYMGNTHLYNKHSHICKQTLTYMYRNTHTYMYQILPGKHSQAAHFRHPRLFDPQVLPLS